MTLSYKIIQSSLKKLLLLSAAAFFFFSCTTLEKTPVTERGERLFENFSPEWTALNPYVSYYLFKDKTLPLRAHFVKIDLSAPSLSIKTYPSKPSDLKKGITAASFAKKSQSFISVNTSPFKGRFVSPRTICGIHKTDGTLLSEETLQYSALAFCKTQNGIKGKVLQNQTKHETQDWEWCFGGFYTILKNKEIQKFKHTSFDSRTAAGLSEDGKTLILLCAEGEKSSESAGLSFPECAELLLRLGCVDALEMDGGRSTSLYINKKNVLSYTTYSRCAAWLGFCFD